MSPLQHDLSLVSPSLMQYYVSPLSWGLQAIVINEMTQDRWNVTPPALGGQSVGRLVLDTFDMRSDREFIWWGLLYHLASFVVMTGLTALVLSLIENPRTPSVVPDETALAKYREVRPASTGCQRCSRSCAGHGGRTVLKRALKNTSIAGSEETEGTALCGWRK